MSVLWHEADRERSLAAGSRHHLVKPAEPEHIERILEQVEPAH